jgi:hypothetical protein
MPHVQYSARKAMVGFGVFFIFFWAGFSITFGQVARSKKPAKKTAQKTVQKEKRKEKKALPFRSAQQGHTQHIPYTPPFGARHHTQQPHTQEHHTNKTTRTTRPEPPSFLPSCLLSHPDGRVHRLPFRCPGAHVSPPV